MITRITCQLTRSHVQRTTEEPFILRARMWTVIKSQAKPHYRSCRSSLAVHCNSLYHNSLARAVVIAPKSSHITPILRSLHSLKITQRIEYKLLSLTYKVLTTTQPSYLHNLITVQPPRSTRSSFLVTLARPFTSSSLRITDRSFQYASPRLRNQLPAPLRQPRTNLSNSASPSSFEWNFLHRFHRLTTHHPSSPHSFIPGLKLFFS